MILYLQIFNTKNFSVLTCSIVLVYFEDILKFSQILASIFLEVEEGIFLINIINIING